MSRNIADIKIVNIVNDYDRSHYNWSEEEYKALGDYKAMAEILKNRLEANGLKVCEMHIVEHNSAKDYLHYHVLIKLDNGATLEAIAKYLGVNSSQITKPQAGRYAYSNSLSYLIHIKDEDKIQYSPDDVITIIGTPYSDYYKQYYKSWLNGKKKKSQSISAVYKEAARQIENGEISFDTLATVDKYRKLILDVKYRRKLKNLQDGVDELARQDYLDLSNKIRNKEITSKEEFLKIPKYRIACEKYKDYIDSDLSRIK